MKTIIAIDPGKLTGYVASLYDDKNNTLLDYVTGELDQMDICSWLEKSLERGPDYLETEVVFEKFFITPETGKKNDTHYSLEIIGVIRYFAWKNGISLYGQSPSDAKNFCDNKRLKNIDLWHVGGEGHAKDALRHLALHLVKNRNWRPEGLLK